MLFRSDYHLRKANVMVDTLSQKSSPILAHICTTYVPLLLDLKTLGINLDYDYNGALVAKFLVRPTLIDHIRGKQMQDNDLVRQVQIMNGKIGENFITQDGVIMVELSIGFFLWYIGSDFELKLIVYLAKRNNFGYYDISFVKSSVVIYN